MMTIESNCFAKLSSFPLPYIDWKLSTMQPVGSYLQKERLLLLERGLHWKEYFVWVKSLAV